MRLTGKLVLILVLLMFSCRQHLYAQQILAGTMSADRTLSPDEFDYYVVTDNYIVPQGITLTIMPGTRLRIMVGMSIKVEQGDLIATGTAEEPVVFEAWDPQKKWKGISFSNSQTILDDNNQYVSGSILSHAVIREILQEPAISLNDTSILLAEHIKLENCDYGIKLNTESRLLLFESTINMCSYGIYILSSGNNVIKNCNITNCDIGINFASNSISQYNIIENNNISYNELIALFIPGNSRIQHNKIKGNTITNNTIGLHVGNSGDADTGYNAVTHNIVQYNGVGIKQSEDSDTLYYNLIENNSTGLLLTKASFNTIRNNIVRNNGEAGIRLQEVSNDNLFEQNTIYDNRTAVRIDTSYCTGNTFRYNSITGNRVETFHIGSGPQQIIEYNTILSGSDTSSFLNRSVHNVMAPNNYWGTADTAVINNIISDIHDYPKYGEVMYKPFSGEPDIETPISRPMMAIKRLINNEVHVNWWPNKEVDLAGYRVYYGAEPETITDNLLDTLIVIQGISFDEMVKVTAYDNMADGTDDRYEGHESAFTIAIAGPYAGGMNSVCSGNEYFTGPATAIEYESLQWITAGDGTFLDTHALHTYYMPGFNDKALGYVNLSLSINTLSGITLTDSMQLDILDYLIIDAGKDTLIIEGFEFKTTESMAQNYTGLQWTTAGDGSYEYADSLLTAYIPGVQDIKNGWVKLTLTISSDCGSLSDDIILSIIPGYDISGTVTRSLQPQGGAIILAYHAGEQGTRAITTSTSNSEGVFMLKGITEGDYYIYAVPDPADVNSHIPTYYATRYSWEPAYLMKLNQDVYDVDIELRKLDLVLPLGQGTISGLFTYEGEPDSDFGLYNRQWFDHTTGNPFIPQAGDAYPAANHVVLLMNSELTKITGWTLSNLDGSFTFTGLPYGAYRLWGEKAGYTNKISPIIYITPENSNVVEVELTVDKQQKLIEAYVEEPVSGEGILYPNPAENYFYINAIGLEGEMDVEIEIINEKGLVVVNSAVQRTSASSFGPVDVAGLGQGIYLCVIKSSSGVRKTTKIAIF